MFAGLRIKTKAHTRPNCSPIMTRGEYLYPATLKMRPLLITNKKHIKKQIKVSYIVSYYVDETYFKLGKH